jgi:1,2-diacylglycerol 3-alpha-glucosyltransferase
LIPTLLPQYPNLRYDIYGNGPNETKLNNLVAELNLKDNVNFNGSIPYDQFQSTVSGAGLFVGSGTALIEAAAMGIPALVGIESIETAETYGFLSDIKGLSYNEDVSYIKKTSIIDNIKELLSNENYRVFISDSCQKKSQDFSIITTVNGFLSITGAQSNNYQNLPNIRMLFSLFFMALFERTRLISSFAERRNQSY